MEFPEKHCVPQSRSYNAINPQEVERENSEPLGNMALKKGTAVATNPAFNSPDRNKEVTIKTKPSKTRHGPHNAPARLKKNPNQVEQKPADPPVSTRARPHSRKPTLQLYLYRLFMETYKGLNYSWKRQTERENRWNGARGGDNGGREAN